MGATAALYPAWREPGIALGDVMELISYWIADVPSPRHVFSLHNLVAAGERYGNGPGKWVGPNDACQALRYVEKHSRAEGWC